MDLTLIGEGVDPVVEVTPRDGPIDWGHVMMGDTVVQTLQLVNMSELSVDFCLKMESLMLPQSKQKGNEWMNRWMDGWMDNPWSHEIMKLWDYGWNS